jgi:hypothetical protein
VYQSYVQGSCTLESGRVIKQGSKTRSWKVSFHYLVSTKDGQVESQGYDLPEGTTFSSYASAQSVVDSYTIGKTYPCWYNPQKPTSAALVLHSRSLTDFAWASAGASVIGIVLLLVLLFIITDIFYSKVYLPACLMDRGIVTQGQVQQHVTRRQNRRTRTYSRIVYQRQEFPGDWQSFEAKGTYPIGSWQPVCYDPSRPTNIRRGHRPLGFGPALSMLWGLALILGVGAAIVFVWNLV